MQKTLLKETEFKRLIKTKYKNNEFYIVYLKDNLILKTNSEIEATNKFNEIN